MKNFKTLYGKNTEITSGLISSPVGKYAYHVLFPDSIRTTDEPLQLMLWGHGSLDNSNQYEDLIHTSRSEMDLIYELCIHHKVVAIMPVLPRSTGSVDKPDLDAQMFGSPTMIHNWDDFYFRPDREILNALGEIRKSLNAAGYSVKEKIHIGGISAGANMANRFALLYPHLVNAVAIPLAGNYAYPVSEIQGINLPYPFGVSNIKEIEGVVWKRDAYSTLPFFIYDGALDNNVQNDPLPYEISSMMNVNLNELKSLFGATPYLRAQHFYTYMKNIESPVTFETDKDLEHQVNEQTISKIFDFFAENQ